MPSVRRTIDAVIDDDLDLRLFRRLPSAVSCPSDDDSDSRAAEVTAASPPSAALPARKRHQAETSRRSGGPASRQASFCLFGSPSSSGVLSPTGESQDDATGFATALGRHRQEQDAQVESLMFVLGAAARRPSAAALAKVTDALEETPQLLQWTRRSARSAEFVKLLSGIATRDALTQAAQLNLIDQAASALPVAAVATVDVFRALSAIIDPTDAGAASMPAAASKPVRKHWSAAARKPTPASESAACAKAGLAPDAAASTPSAEQSRTDAARIVLDIAAAAYSDGTGVDAAALRGPVGDAIADSGLWSVAARLIAARHPAADFLCAALDLSVCCAGASVASTVARAPADELFIAAVTGFAAAGERTTAKWRHQLCRLIMNLCTAAPRLITLPDTDLRARTIAAAGSTIRASVADNDTDGLSLTACAVLNLLTIQPPGADTGVHTGAAGQQYVNNAWRGACVGCSDFIEVAARTMVSMHAEEGEVEKNVCAGYLALLLASVTLGDEAARVAVLKQVSKALPASSTSDKRLAERPMRYVAAVVQEFVMFQSAAGILTKEALVTMHRVSSQLLAENGGESA